MCKIYCLSNIKGVILTPDMPKGIEWYVDTDFSSNCHSEYAEDINGLLARTGFILFFWRYPITWVSKLRTKINISATEVEYIALSHLMRELILIENLFDSFEKKLEILPPITIISCKIFEDDDQSLD